jgi:RNA polymerase sigma-70 factor (ECF subfamily)
MDNYSDYQIFSGIQSGDNELFEYLFLNYYEPLCFYAYGILRNRENAEEMVQDVFIKLWDGRKQINIQTSVKSYLYKSVHNKCVNFINHKRIEEKFSNEFKQENVDLVSPVSKDYPIANLLSQELGTAIQNAIASLPEQCREVFIMIRQDEMSYAEVAETLEISVNTVKTQLQRAITRLRELLQEYLP